MNAITEGRFVPAVLVTLTLLAGGHAWAQAGSPPSSPPPLGGSVGYFGEHGQIAVSGDMKFSVLRESVSMGGGSVTVWEFSPALDYFVSSNVSIGGLLGISKTSDGQTTIRIGPRVGYNAFLTNVVSIWVRGGLAYEHYSNTIGGVDVTGYTMAFNVYAPLLWHPVPHFFLGAGPFLETDFISKVRGQDAGKLTTFGISSTIGGYFGGL